MNKVNMCKENDEIKDLLDDICDLVFLEEYEAMDDYDGMATYNLKGKAFAKDASGGRFVELEDLSIGYIGSEGECGRVSESMEDFLVFMVNTPFWMDYTYGPSYTSDDTLKERVSRLKENHQEMVLEDMELDLKATQERLASLLDINLVDDTSLLWKFHEAATRAPLFVQIITEDGVTYKSSGTLL